MYWLHVCVRLSANSSNWLADFASKLGQTPLLKNWKEVYKSRFVDCCRFLWSTNAFKCQKSWFKQILVGNLGEKRAFPEPSVAAGEDVESKQSFSRPESRLWDGKIHRSPCILISSWSLSPEMFCKCEKNARGWSQPRTCSNIKKYQWNTFSHSYWRSALFEANVLWFGHTGVGCYNECFTLTLCVWPPYELVCSPSCHSGKM